MGCEDCPPLIAPTVLDDFDNRSFGTDDVPLFATTPPSGGTWGTASSGIAYLSPMPSRGSAWVTVTGGIGRITYDPNRYLPSSATNTTSTVAQNDTSHLFPSPAEDEPTFSFRFRTSLIPDGSAGSGATTRGRTEVLWKWWAAADGFVSLLDGGLVVSSVVGVGNINIRGATLAKADWVADAWYTVYGQYLHNGTLQAKVVKDGDTDPGWQVVYATGADYGSWGGGGKLALQLNTFDNWTSPAIGPPFGDVIVTEFDDLMFGRSGTPYRAQVIGDESIGLGDGTTTAFTTRWAYLAGSLQVTVGGMLAEVDFTDPATGSFTLVDPAPLGAPIHATYRAAGV